MALVDLWIGSQDQLKQKHVQQIIAFAGDGKLLDETFDREECAARYARRLRTLAGIPVPARMLRKGINVLAIEVHRSCFMIHLISTTQNCSITA